MLAFGARVVGIELAKMIVDAWLSGEYEGGRHQVRIDMLKEIEENTYFNKGEDTVWICLNCGHIHVGAQAPEECPVCAHARAYFQELKDHYE